MPSADAILARPDAVPPARIHLDSPRPPEGCVGRGHHYGSVRPYLEWSAYRLFRGGWPARLARALGAQRRVLVHEHAVAVAGWPAGAPSLTVAFGSDFHAGPTTHPRLLELACRRLAEAKPDVLLLGGDFVYLCASFVDALAQGLGAVPAPAGRFAVLGNHDLWADDRYVQRRLEAAGIEVLVNRNVRLPPPFDHVSVCGIDEAWVGDPDGDAAFAGAAERRILLTHSPSGLVFAKHRAFDLALCGHTHGGHIALPGGRPIYLPHGPLVELYPHGRYEMPHADQGPLIVSRGVGGVELPFRSFAPPDILRCVLGPA